MLTNPPVALVGAFSVTVQLHRLIVYITILNSGVTPGAWRLCCCVVVLCKHRSDEVAQKATFWSDGTIIWV